MSQTTHKNKNQETITRKEALKKMGKYAALTAAGTFLILNPKTAQAQSPEPPGDGFRLFDD
jgi:hypothetical protein